MLAAWVRANFTASILIGIALVVLGWFIAAKSESRMGWVMFAGGFAAILFAMKVAGLF